MNKRIIGSNSHGFTNEYLIVEALNEKKVKDLNSNLKKFVKDISFDNKISISDETIVKAGIETNNKLKQDIYIYLSGIKFAISLKMGTGNSVHQEKIEEFIDWLNKVLGVQLTDIIKDDFRFFIWADGSIDGQAPINKDKEGKIIGRFGGKEFRKLYPEKRIRLQNFLDDNAEVILNRTIFEGKNGSKVDYVYHGNPSNGVWISRKDILKFNIEHPKSKTSKNVPALSVGKLTVQAWNVSLRGNTEKKRGEVQFKYSSMVDDFEKLMHMKAINIGTFEGEQEEFNLSKLMNKNKTHKFWNLIREKCNMENNINNYYVVKVDGNKESKITGKKVKCKTDDFVICANISKNYLLQNEYQITENMLKDIGQYEIVMNSGISVKRADSKKYTIVKLTHNTFKKAFEKYIDGIEFIIAGLLLYEGKNKEEINKKILNDLGIKKEKLKKFYVDKNVVSDNENLDTEFVKKISKKSKLIVNEIIDNNLELKASLFTGKGWFDNPYYINFIFKNGKLTSDVYTDYIVTNGSGRSKGIYTIILKPR